MRLNSDPIPNFQEKTVPPDTRLAGWSALVRALAVQAPVRRPVAVSEKHVRGSRRQEGGWPVFDKRYWPGEEFGDHLGFALRHEEIDLLVLKRVFAAVPEEAVAAFVRSAPKGAPNRRAPLFVKIDLFCGIAPGNARAGSSADRRNDSDCVAIDR